MNDHPFPLRRILLLAALLGAPVLWMGLLADDWCLLGRLARGQTFGAYDFVSSAEAFRDLLTRGLAPWWMDPEIRACFCRPLSSALLALEARAFGTWAFPYHLHTLAWYLLLVALVGTLFRRLFPARLAGLATVLYALDSNHALNVAWTANRHATISVALGLLAVLLHLSAREPAPAGPDRAGDPGRALLASRLLLVLALLAGETGLEVCGLMAAYELLAARPGRGRTSALGWLVLLGGGYLLLHRGLGFEVRGIDIYVDPALEPLRFCRELWLRLPALLGCMLLRSCADLWAFHDGLKPVLALAGWVALGAFGLALRRPLAGLDADSRRHLGWLWAGCALALLPAAATGPAGRQVLLPSLASAVGLALVIDRAGASLPARAFGRAMAWIHLVASPLALAAQLGFLVWLSGFTQARLPLEAIRTQVGPHRRAVVLTAPVLDVAVLPMMLDLRGRELVRSWTTLAWKLTAFRLDRPDARTLDMTLLFDPPVRSEVERLMRSARKPLAPGDRFDLDGFQATVLEVGRWGPTRVRFCFDRPLEDPDLVFLASLSGLPRPVPLPAPGGTMFLAAPGIP